MDDYIKREAIQKRLNRIVEVNNLRTDRAWFTPYGVNALIEEIPAADVVEVRHGRWVYGYDAETGEQDIKAWTCSLCHEKYPWQPTYCPNCGMRLDYREGDEDAADRVDRR